MNQVGVYLQDDGKVAVVFPAPSALQSQGIDAVVARAVPAGKPFGIFEQVDLPKDVPQEFWVVDEALLADGVGVNDSGE